MNHTYKIFINGKFLNETNNYNFAMNRALGLAMYKGLDFINTKSKNIVDKWSNGKEMIIITKH